MDKNGYMIYKKSISDISKKTLVISGLVIFFAALHNLLKMLRIEDLLLFVSTFVDLKGHAVNAEDIKRLDLYLGLIKRIPICLIVLFSGWVLLGDRIRNNGRIFVQKIACSKYFPFILIATFITLSTACGTVISFSQFPLKWFFLSVTCPMALLVFSTAILGMAVLKYLDFGFDNPEKTYFIIVSGAVTFSAILGIIVSTGARMTLSLCAALLVLQYSVAFIFLNKRIREPAEPVFSYNGKSIAYLGILLLISVILSWGFYLFMTSAPGSDIASQGQIAAWLKAGESFRLVRPFFDSSYIVLRYPPAFSGLIAFYSKISNIPININAMALWLLSYPLYTCLIFFVCRFITKSSALGLFCALLSLNAESLGSYAHNSGQVQEALANISGIYALYVMMLYEKSRPYRNCLIASIFLAASMLFQTGVAFIFVCTLALYPIIASIIKQKFLKKEFLQNYFTLIISFLIMLPWLWPQVSSAILNDKGTNSTFLSYSLFRYMPFDVITGKNLLITVFFILGLYRLFVYKKEKKETLAISWLLAAVSGLLLFGSTMYYRAYGFMAIRIIIAAYGLILIKDVFKNVKYPNPAHTWNKPAIKHFSATLMFAGWLVFFLPELIFFRSNSILTQGDYRALEWIKNNSPKEGTLLLNAMGKNSLDVQYYGCPMHQWWAGAVSERKAVNFKVGLHQSLIYSSERPDEYDIDPSATTALELNAAYQNIEKEESQKILFKHKISYIVVSSRDSSDMVKKINELCGESKFFRKVFTDKESMVVKVCRPEIVD